MGKRIIEVDIAKGLGMLMVVFGHLNMYGMGLDGITSFIFIFHVPLFFFLSGLFYRKKDTIGKTVVSKLKGLYLPFFLANLAFLIVDVIRFDTHINIIDFLSGRQIAPLVDALWFVICLFYASVLYKIVDRTFNSRLIPVSIVAIILFIVGYKIPQLTILCQTLIAFFLYHLGRVVSEFKGIQRWTRIPLKVQIPVFAVSGCVIWMLSRVNSVNMASGQYGMPLLFILGVISGILFTFSFSCTVVRIHKMSIVFEYIGKRTMWIIVFHMVIIQALFLFHEFIIPHIGKYDPPMWFWYILIFLLSSFTPCVMRDCWNYLKNKFGKRFIIWQQR